MIRILRSHLSHIWRFLIPNHYGEPCMQFMLLFFTLAGP